MIFQITEMFKTLASVLYRDPFEAFLADATDKADLEYRTRLVERMRHMR